MCHGGQKRVSGPLGLKLQPVGCCHVGAGIPRAGSALWAISLAPILTGLEVTKAIINRSPDSQIPWLLVYSVVSRSTICIYKLIEGSRSESPVPPGTQWLLWVVATERTLRTEMCSSEITVRTHSKLSLSAQKLFPTKRKSGGFWERSVLPPGSLELVTLPLH